MISDDKKGTNENIFESSGGGFGAVAENATPHNHNDYTRISFNLMNPTMVETFQCDVERVD
jgi:hypothetical protein